VRVGRRDHSREDLSDLLYQPTRRLIDENEVDPETQLLVHQLLDDRAVELWARLADESLEKGERAPDRDLKVDVVVAPGIGDEYLRQPGKAAVLAVARGVEPAAGEGFAQRVDVARREAALLELADQAR